MAAPTRTVDEIVARISARQALLSPRLRGMWAVQGGAAFLLAATLLVDYFAVALPFSLDALAFAGPPLKVVLVVVLLAEGALVAQRLARHREPAYPDLARAAGGAQAAAGGVAAGVGLVVRTVWVALLASYFPEATWVSPLSAALMLGGAAVLLAGLPTVGASALRPLADR